MTPHYRTCSLCEAMCGLVVETEGGRVTSIRGDDDDPFSRGHICPKAVALQDLHEDPDRLRHPVKRVGSSWQPISWHEAYTLVEVGLRRAQREHGRDAVGIYLGNPTVHSLGATLFAPRFVKALRTKNRYSATSVDQLPHHLAALWMFGHPLLIPIPDLDRTDHLLVIGANPVASNGSLMTAPDVAKRLKAIKARGGRIVVIDPRRNETAELAGEHHFIRPGADAAFVLALVHVILAEGLERAGTTGAYATGLAEVRAIAAEWPPERVAAATGIAADEIRTIARDFARAERAVAYGRIGVSTQEFGALACWLISLLNAVTGRIDVPGGAMFTRPAVGVMQGGGSYGGAGRFGRWRTRVRGLPEFAGELPVSALAEEMETPGDGQIRALVTHAGNPVLSTPNGARLDRAIAGLEFYAAIDFYVNETTRHAHVILPPVGPLERDQYDVVFHALAIRNTAKYSPPLFAKPADARYDWEILTELTARMTGGGVAKRLRALAEWAMVRWLGTRGVLDRELKRGPYGRQGLSVRTLEANPHGVDLGALEPMLPRALRTDDRTVHLAPAEVVGDVRRLAATVDAPAGAHDGALSLIGRRELRSNNSWMHNSERLVRGKARCTLLMHPADATARGLADGELVTVTSRTGRVDVRLETTDAMMPGVVSLPHGWGHGRDGVQLRVAQRHAGASINDLTDDQRTDALSGNAAFCGVPVRVERAAV
ncbi:MAG: molybdopterin-dependent oxidoreductase [Gemmatimonadetes bacterium]|nr:molybdopterin-dependent oxidoreductase [Gemmatimonadota bacterium]MBI3504443.1 molybdopterin-dependent oxidoreductase [Pseudomonadota bacterium]